MLTLLRAFIDRVKAMILTIAVREIEEDVLIRQAEVHGGLRRLAKLYDTGKESEVADEIRRQLDAPLDAGVLAAAAETSVRAGNPSALAGPSGNGTSNRHPKSNRN